MTQKANNLKLARLLVLAAVAAISSGLVGLNGMSQGSDKTPQTVKSSTGAGQPTIPTTRVAVGQKMDLEGVILRRDPDSIVVRDLHGSNYVVKLGSATEVREKKSNPFRRAKSYAITQLLRGLNVEIRGVGDSSGDLVGGSIKIRPEDMRTASTVESRVEPVETRLAETETRLNQSEQNAQRLSGQVQELEVIANAARGGAKAAQAAADSAAAVANAAGAAAQAAKAGVTSANQRISSLDDVEVKGSAMVRFAIGSAALSREATAELDRLVENIRRDRGFMIEVCGFSSAEGSNSANLRLSQLRADAVIRYLAENYSIPLRRFVTPFGYGEKQPIGDNKTRTGRTENRRVEVKILVNKGLTQPAVVVTQD
jgi:outer membrane protein OmpA-like peptidoglycan-associated protein